MSSSSAYKFNYKSFSFYLRRSSYIHLALLATTLIGGKIVFEIKEKTRSENLELIQASVRVDMVAMPTHTLNELKNISSGVEEAKKEETAPVVEKVVEKEEVKDEPKEEPKAEKADNSPAFEEAKAAKKRQDFLSKLKKIGTKKVESTGNQKAEKGLYGANDSDLKKLVLSGNKLSRGTQIYGDGGGAEMTAFQAYATRLPDIIKPRWVLPDFLMNKNLQCRIRIWINMSGELTRAEVLKSSGDSEFDQRAIEAIRSAAPFPALSSEFAAKVQKGDIVLGFPL